MQINSSLSTPVAPPVQSGRPQRGTDSSQPVESFQASQPANGPQDPRQAGHSHHNKYPSNHPQIQHGSARANIQGASSGGALAGISAATLHYPDGRWNLKALADADLKAGGLATDYPDQVKAQVDAIQGPAQPDATVQDLRSLKFSSIDNPTSQDLDQLEWAQKLPNGDIRVRVAVTDVGSLVPKNSPLDQFTKENTSSIYTADKIYNLLPEKLSLDLISLNGGQDRLAMVTSYTVDKDGNVKDDDVCRGYVHNYAKMDYPTIGKWLASGAPDQAPPQLAQGGPEMLDQVRLQNEAAERLKAGRQAHGALTFADSEVDLEVKDGSVVGTVPAEKNGATELVENFMVSANGAMSRFLREKGYPSIQRVVKVPEKWDQIQQLAAEKGYHLSATPDGKSLENFLEAEKAKNPKGFSDLSGSVIRLIGRGEFEACAPGQQPTGHFGLGVTDYAQQTASMRRRGDRINIDLAKDALAGRPASYTMAELQSEADNLTDKESVIKKAERQIQKSALASLLEHHVGENYQGVISFANDRSSSVRINNPIAEGRLLGGKGLHVGNQVNVKLSNADVLQGHIDFSRA